MKKLIMAMVVALAAAIVQAAAIDWTASGIVDPVATAAAGKNTPAKGWLGYVIMSADYATVTADLAAGDTTSLLSSYVGQSKQTTSKGAFAAATATGNVAAGDQTFYLIVLNSSNVATATQFYTSAVYAKTIDASLDTALSFPSQATGTKAAANWTAMAVPEPTSGLLLLLGMAGLALKRKRA